KSDGNPADDGRFQREVVFDQPLPVPLAPALAAHRGYFVRVSDASQPAFCLPPSQLVPETISFCAPVLVGWGSLSVTLCMCASRRGLRFVPPSKSNTSSLAVLLRVLSFTRG